MAGKDGGARRTTVTPKRGRANVSEDGTNASKRERHADASSSDAAELERLRRKNEELEERLRRRDDEELERLRRELAEVRADRLRADDSRTAHGSNIASIDGAKRLAETFAETLTQMGAAFGAIGTFLGGHVNTPKPATPATRGGSSAGSPREVDATVGEDARGEDDEREDDFRRAVGTVNQRAGVTWTCVAMKDDRAECVAACKHYDGCSWKQTYKSGTSVYFSCSTHVNCDAKRYRNVTARYPSRDTCPATSARRWASASSSTRVAQARARRNESRPRDAATASIDALNVRARRDYCSPRVRVARRATTRVSIAIATRCDARAAPPSPVSFFHRPRDSGTFCKPSHRTPR